MLPSPSGESHVVTRDPDLLIGHFIGHISVDDMQRILDIQRNFSAGKPGIFLLVNVERLENITPEARRLASEGAGERGAGVPILGVALVGARFHARILGAMVVRAARILHGGPPFDVRFFDTDAAALAWIDKLRSAS
ncbi:STAS/SEC14 domain-containing protein [Polyangium jinanense]|uniref:STAS/SEC14 domain-containing protein n=1 Tax=Polyangium jinanense TaxID=2829994 RepID=A0A9X3XIM6_9BACT|nr:STAS/SEC14 domain-containing protein [Polyangium jinanense]MDC3962055.1 STAS/SEC14 domain-containing protein [Polyangium jinanense]MDC3988771.1 STAS/SEC14 domain-containing protein [Polyangium jinanense]